MRLLAAIVLMLTISMTPLAAMKPKGYAPNMKAAKKNKVKPHKAPRKIKPHARAN